MVVKCDTDIPEIYVIILIWCHKSMSGRCLTSYINTFVNDKYNIEYVAMLIIPFLYNNPIVLTINIVQMMI
jgi:hypothetical protein